MRAAILGLKVLYSHSEAVDKQLTVRATSHDRKDFKIQQEMNF